MTEFSVEAGCASVTTTGVAGGIDVCFTLTLDGAGLDGEVTLLPHEDGRPGYGAWGSVDHWLDGRTVAALRRLSSADHAEVCDAILEATAPVAEDYAE